jgi:hypothetical protein
LLDAIEGTKFGLEF